MHLSSVDYLEGGKLQAFHHPIQPLLAVHYRTCIIGHCQPLLATHQENSLQHSIRERPPGSHSQYILYVIVLVCTLWYDVTGRTTNINFIHHSLRFDTDVFHKTASPTTTRAERSQRGHLPPSSSTTKSPFFRSEANLFSSNKIFGRACRLDAP